ncbi:MAG: cadherin-like beta sandwich domain-containing protein, partial [Acholeplasma sp.]|nr:cadherin-like beta sandwich domain-containing protein [Acholeplasma sp.]
LVTLDSNKQFTYTLKQGINQITIQSESEYGTKGAIYTYQYEQLVPSSNAVLKSLIGNVDGVNRLSGLTIENLMTIRLDRSFAGKLIGLVAEADENGVIVSGNGTKPLQLGKNEFRFVVRSEDGTQEVDYILTIYVANDDTNVSGIKVNNQLIDGFDKSILDYQILTPYKWDTTLIILAVTMESPEHYALISGVGTMNLMPGTQTFDIVIRSEYRTLINDVSQDVVYSIEVTRNEAYSDTNLQNLLVLDNNSVELPFDSVITYKPGTYNYTITLPKTASVTSVLIDPILKDDTKQVLSGDYGVRSLTTAPDGTIKQSYTFVVTAEDGTFREYNVTILQGTTLSSDSSIKTVSLRDFFANEYLIDSEAFDVNKLQYIVTVPFSVTNLNLTVTPNDTKAVVSGNGEYSIGNNPLTIVFYVTAEDKTEGTRYEIIVTRNQPSSDASLKELTITTLDSEVLVGDASLNPLNLVFDPATLVYRLTLDRSHEFIHINAVENHPNAIVSGDISTQFLVGGEVTLLRITVKAEDNKTQKTYFVYVDVKNRDIEITDLSVTGYDFVYDQQTDYYDLGIVAIGTQTIDIFATISDSFGTLTGTGRVFLVDGENLFVVSATSEDKSKTVSYTIRVERPIGGGTGPISTDNTLYDLIIEGTQNSYPLNFNESTLTYDVQLDYMDGQFNLNAVKNPRASVTGAGFHSLQPGQTKAINVTVTAEDGTVGTTYTVNVTRSLGDSDNQLSEFYIIENGVKRLLDETKAFQEVVIASNTTEIEIGAVGPSTAQISGLGVVAIDTEDTYITVIVTSENGIPKAFNIKVMKVSSDATLKDLTVLDNNTQMPITYNPVFDPNTLNYNIDLTAFPQILEIELQATPNSIVKDITGLGIHTLKSGIGMTTDRYNITVTAQDGTTIRTYTVTVTRNIDPEDSITIDDLSLYGDTILYLGNDKYPQAPMQFTLSQKEYMINVPYQTQKALLYVGNLNGASIYGAGEYPLGTKETVIVFYLVSKSGLVQSDAYTIRVVKADPSTDNALKSLTMNGSALPGFDPEKTSYTFNVDSALVSQVSIGATKNDPYAILSGDLGNVPIVPGKNTINVTVIAEDGTPRVYSITINSLSNDASIYSLGVENHSITPTFDPTKTVYRLTVSFDVTMVNIYATGHEKAVILGTGVKNLQVGVNLFTVYARSEGNTEGTRYQIEITRTEPSSDTTLQSLVVKDKNGNALPFTGSFSPDTRDYIINLPEDSNLSSVLIEAETMHDKSNVYGIGNVLLGGFIDGKYHTIVKVSVMAEDGTIGEYSISFYRGVTLSDLAEIESLNLLGSDSVSYLGTYENSLIAFDGETLSYTITVPYYVMNMNLQVTAVGTVYGAGVKLFGTNSEITYNLYVVSQNGSNQTATYTIRVIKEQAEVDNFLNSLTIDGVLVKGFDPEQNAYMITMPTQSSKESITIGATTDSNAVIQGLGNKPLLPGENVFPVSVVAQTGEVNTYTVTINYVHSNALLDTLQVKGVSGDTYNEEDATTFFTPDEFENSTFSYVVLVGPNTTKVRLTGTTEDQESGARVSGFRTYDFPINMESKVIEIEVTSADGLQTQIYQVELVRNGKADDNSKLNSLVVEGQRLAFNPTNYSYSINVNSNTPNLNLSAEAFSPNAKVTVMGYEQGQASNEVSIAIDDLKAGNNVVLIRVEAEDGSMSYYRLSINKDAQPDYMLTVLLIVTFLLWVITVVFFLIKLSRDKKEENRKGMII